LKPVDLDPAAVAVELHLMGQTLRYAHGQPVPQTFEWPAAQGQSQLARVTFFPTATSEPPPFTTREGEWAVFRLFSAGRLTPAGGRPDLFNLSLQAGKHQTRFELAAGSVESPFDLRLFSRFQCPSSL
jgi:type VI secretion system protein ImpL